MSTPVVERVDVDLDRVVEEAVDEHGVLRAGDGGPLDVAGERLVVVDDLHAAAAEHVRRPHEHRVADLPGDVDGLVGAVGCRAWARAGSASCSTRPNAPRSSARSMASGGADDRHPLGLERLGQAERGLAAELDDDPGDRAGVPLGVDDLEDVLEGERLEVERSDVS
jgi:hypothetical protein